MTDMARPPIIFGCASDHELPVAAVADALQREGHPVEVISGVDLDEAELAAATDRLRGPALFVLCRSDALGRSIALRIEGLLSARKGPLHRVTTVDVPVRVPTSVVPEIVFAAAQLGVAGGSDREDSGRFMREVVVPTSVAAVPGATTSGRSARERWSESGDGVVEEPRGISDDALGLGDDTDVFDPQEYQPQAEPEPPPEPEVLISTDPDTTELRQRELAQALAEEFGDGVPEAVTYDRTLADGSQPGIPTSLPHSPSWDRSGPVEVERVAARVRSDPRAEADDRPLPSASTPITISEEAEPMVAAPPPPRRTGARLLLLLMAAAGMAGILIMALMHDTTMAGAKPAPRRGVPPAAPAAVPDEGRAAVVPPTGEGSTGSDGAQDDAAGSTSGAAAVADASGGVEGGTTGGEGEGEELGEGSTGASDSAAEPAADEPAAAGSGPAPVVPPPPNTAPSASQLEAAIAAAIEQGRLMEHEDLLVLPTGADTMAWEDAIARCRRRKVEGMRGWRLPTKGQLARLRKAKLVSSGTYWSSSVVGGDEAYAVDAGSGRMNVWLKMEPNARAICVRKRP